ncbi:MAG: L,D-transpeptidase [Halomonas subglaciescola]|nr:L,D-transpeptidase [Halomonas subglaciescola]
MFVHRRRFLVGALACLAAYATPASAGFLAEVAFVDLVEQQLVEAAKPRYPGELWVLVDDKYATLDVYRGNTPVEHFSPISFGRSGASSQRLRGGNVTPLGEFRVNRFNYDSRWNIFMGIDYPTPDHARMALRSGIYSRQEYEAYFDYYRRYGKPPQNTTLGGAIGLHGLGEADPEVHERFDWTQGCVALTDNQIERLNELVGIGTRIVIR